jgi:cytochrome P450
VELCSDFLAGMESVTAAFQWIMAKLLKHMDVQETVRRVVGTAIRD